MKSFKSYSDSQHGWVAVKRKLLTELGILGKVSRCSYQRGQTVYLEEDADLTLFVQAFKNKFGVLPTFTEGKCGDYSPIRSYQNFHLLLGERELTPPELYDATR